MNKLIIILFILLVTGIAFAEWRFNPYTGKLDYYEGNSTMSTYNVTVGGLCWDSDTCMKLSGDTLTLTVHGAIRQTWVTVQVIAPPPFIEFDSTLVTFDGLGITF